MKPLLDAPLAIVDLETTGAQLLQDAARTLAQLPAPPAHLARGRTRVMELASRPH